MFTSGLKDLNAFLKGKSDIIMTSTTIEFCDMLLNWYYSLKKIGLADKAFAVALDKDSYSKLQKNNIPCAFIDTNIKNYTAADWIENAKYFKPKSIIYTYENYAVNVIHLDTDIVFFKDFIDKLKQESLDHDIVMASDKRFNTFNNKRIKDKIITVNSDKKSVTDWGLAEQAKFGEKNAAIMYLGQEKREKNLYYLKRNISEELYSKFPRGVQEGSLQTISNCKELLEETKIKIKLLSVYDFPNGSLWQVPYLREYVKDSCYLVHYNFYSHADPKQRLQEKIQAMKKFGHWYL